MFLVNSWLGQFSAAAKSFDREDLHSQRHPFSRSYGVILPSSLTAVISSALGFSPHLPVSVLVRILTRLPRGFSRRLIRQLRAYALGINSGLTRADLPTRHPRPYTGTSVTLIAITSASPHWSNVCQQYGNINPLPIDYAFRPRLRDRLTLGGFTVPRKP